VADDTVEMAKERYRTLLVQSPRGRCGPVGIPSLLRTDVFRSTMRSSFKDHPELESLEVLIDSKFVGYVTREKIFEPARTAGDGAIDSQGATLPGDSTGYRVVWFTCKQHQPTIWIPMAYYDLRYPPSCPENPDHNVDYAL
jgi:hypothetical protein